MRRIAHILLVVILASACAISGFYPKELEPQVAETKAFVDRVATTYGVRQVSIVIGPHVQGIGATYSRGTLLINTEMMKSPHRDALLAHEMSHYLLGHEPITAPSFSQVRSELEVRERDANIKSVEVLARAKSMDEYAALLAVYRHFSSFLQKVNANKTVIPFGHKHPCAEISDLLAAYPQHRARTERWECAPAAWAAAGTPALAVTPLPQRTALPPARDGSTSALIVYAYLTHDPPAPGTFVRTTLNSNLPPRTDVFHAAGDRGVTLFVLVKREGESVRVESRWVDPAGIERKAIQHTMTHAGSTGRYGWQTHVIPIEEIGAMPGSWRVRLLRDGSQAGEYAFFLEPK